MTGCFVSPDFVKLIGEIQYRKVVGMFCITRFILEI